MKIADRIICIGVILLTITFDILSYWFTRYIPEDAVFNLGPVLGILKEGRIVDLLVYKDFNVYYGYPPMFFLPQVLWYGIVGINANMVWAFVVIVHVALVFTFMFVFRSIVRNSIMLGLLTLTYCSGVYYLSGRPDPMAIILILIVFHYTRLLHQKFEMRQLWIVGFLLVAIFFIHPLAFIISSLAFFGSLVMYYRFNNFLPLLVLAGGVVFFILVIYIPFIMQDFESWKTLFLGLSKNQERFKLGGFVKFVGLNAGVFLATAIFLVAGRTNGLRALRKNSFFLVACVALLIPFLWGTSYYFLYVLPFLIGSIVIVFQTQINGDARFYLIFTLCALISLYQGSLGKIIQGLRQPEYAQSLQAARNKVKGYTINATSVYADSQLIPCLTNLDNINLLWHGMKYHRKKIEENAVYAFVLDDSWISNQKNLGNWEDSTKYNMMYRGIRTKGLPALYRKGGHGPDLELRIVRSK